MERRKPSARVLSVLLMLVLLVGLLPFSAFAEGLDEPESAEPEFAAAETIDTEAVDTDTVDTEALIAAPAEAETDALPAPAAETQDEGGTTYTVFYLKYTGGYSGAMAAAQFSHAPGVTVNVSEYARSISRDNTLLKNNEMYRFVFNGWSLTKGNVNDPPTTEYPLDYPKGSSFVMPAHDVNLYAHYQVIDYYHWELSVGPNGAVSHELSASEGSSTSETISLSSAFGSYKVYPTGSSNGGFSVIGTVYRSFVPQPADGYLFDGWYCNGEKLNVETLNASGFPVLTAAMYEAGQNKIEARFMENDGSWVSVKFCGDNDGTPIVYYQQMLKKGDPMPTIADPTRPNHYFLGWSQDVPATVPDEDVTFTAQWLKGPTTSNTPEALYTVRCTTGEHQDRTQGMNYGTSNDDIAYDETRGVYVCTVTLDRLGAYLGIGPACYAVAVGQEHYAVESDPVIRLVWNGSQWVGDGDQIVYVYHETGDEPVPQETLDSLDPIICVVETGNPTNKKALRLIRDTYTVTYSSSLDGNTRIAAVTITDFETYAKKLGFLYAPDWENNLHGQDYYVYYLTRSLRTESVANGSTYLAWGPWGYDKINTELQSTGGVYNNEALCGKELRVKDSTPKHNVTFSDGRNGAVFADVVFTVTEGDPYPWADSGSLEEFEAGLVSDFDLYETQLDDGSVFCGWDPDMPEYAEAHANDMVTEDVTFTARWGRHTYVIYLDGAAEGESFGESDTFEYYSGIDEFPAFDPEDNEAVPEWEGHTFVGWKSVEFEEANGFFEDEETGYTVSWVWEDDAQTYRSFCIFLEAQWASFSIAGANMTLGNELSMNFFVKKADVDPSQNYSMKITKTYADGQDDVVVTVPFENWTDFDSIYYSVRFNGVAAKEMNDLIYVQVFNEDGTAATPVWEDSVSRYVLRILENQNAAVTKTMLVDMLNYGAAAQSFFGYDTGNLANSGLTAAQQAYATQSVTATDGRIQGANYIGSNLSLECNLSFSMFFKNLSPDMHAVVTFTDHYGAAKTVRIEGSAFELHNASSSTYRVRIEEMVVADARQPITCTVYDSNDAEIASATDSIASYIARMSSTSALYESILKFADSAYAYFHQ